MTRSDREHLAKRIVQHYVTVAKKQKNITVNHFLAENILRQTIYNIIRKYDTSDVVGDRPRSGRPRKISSGERTRLKRLVNHKTGISLRRIAHKFNVHRRTIQRELNDMGIEYRKKITCSSIHRETNSRSTNTCSTFISHPAEQRF